VQSGNAYFISGNVMKSIDAYEKALDITIVTGDTRREGIVRGNLGLALTAQATDRESDLSSAKSYCEKAKELSYIVGDRLGEGIAQWNCAAITHKMGDIEEARVRALEALEIFQSSKIRLQSKFCKF